MELLPKSSSKWKRVKMRGGDRLKEEGLLGVDILRDYNIVKAKKARAKSGQGGKAIDKTQVSIGTA